MPEEEKRTVDIDTSGPGAEIDLQEEKQENEIEVASETVENNTESDNSSENLVSCWVFSPNEETKKKK